jgi:dTMP kinase
VARPLLIALEGLDATGKSTLATLLAESIGAVKLSTPPAELRGACRDTIDAAVKGHSLAGQLFYASTVALVSDQVRDVLAAGRSVVVDRYWLSTLVYNRLRPGAADLEAIEQLLLPADLTVLVETADVVRRGRLLQRGATPSDRLALHRGAELAAAYRSVLSRPIAGESLVVDSTHTGPAQLCAVVQAKVEDLIHAPPCQRSIASRVLAAGGSDGPSHVPACRRDHPVQPRVQLLSRGR